MSWRAPWLRERLSLIILALWDLLIVLGVYPVIYLWRTGSWPGVTMAWFVLVCVWLGGSYLLGRYTQSKPVIISCRQTMWLAAGILALFVFQAWLVGIGDTGTRLRSFLLPLITAIALGSGLGHFVIMWRQGGQEKVILICARNEQIVLHGESTLTSKATINNKAPQQM